MKERPILMSSPMIRALLSGQKTQTRRVLKQATGPSLSVDCEDGVAELSWLYGDGPGHEVHESIKRVLCPYGQPGDRLWVREAWGETTDINDLRHNGDWPGRPHIKVDGEDSDVIIYRADGEWQWADGDGFNTDRSSWKPSIHMFRWMSRILLEVVSVRVERLNDISDEDAIEEGVDRTNTSIPGYARERYRRLWESINGAGSWAANPWVWCVEFKRVQP